jgi:hypothetical protein
LLGRRGPEGGGTSTSQCHPYAAFQRALKRRNVLSALAAARDLPQLDLLDALELTVLVARKDPRRHPRVASRWLLRLLEEDPHATIEDAVLAASSLIALTGCRPPGGRADRRDAHWGRYRPPDGRIHQVKSKKARTGGPFSVDQKALDHRVVRRSCLAKPPAAAAAFRAAPNIVDRCSSGTGVGTEPTEPGLRVRSWCSGRSHPILRCE